MPGGGRNLGDIGSDKAEIDFRGAVGILAGRNGLHTGDASFEAAA